MSTLLLTGGAGFIGSALVRHLLDTTPYRVVILDALTYAGNMDNIADRIDGDRCIMVAGSVTDAGLVDRLMGHYGVEMVVHAAAESHVDRSIAAAPAFIDTNVVGTMILLEAARRFAVRRFVQVSTDEVYGTLEPTDPPFHEGTPLAPSSPYSASKASADLLALAWWTTYGVPVMVTRCSNNYGPRQFPEKFIPTMILRALAGEPLPVYGDGRQVRDWIHVDDHCRGILAVLDHGVPGRVYNFGGECERYNIDVATTIVDALGVPRSAITYVTDRPGHDRRYAVNIDRVRHELAWEPVASFDEALRATIAWYQDNTGWVRAIGDGTYRLRPIPPSPLLQS